MVETGMILILIAVGCIIAAIVRGNVTLPGGSKFGAIPSPGARITLAVFAGLVGLFGIILVLVGWSSSLPGPEGSDEPVNPAQSRPGGSREPPPPRAVYMSQVRGVCNEMVLRNQREVSPPKDGASGSEWAATYRQRVAIFDAGLIELRSLTPPAADAPAMRRVWNKFEGVIEAESAYADELAEDIDSGETWQRVLSARRGYNTEARSQVVPIECLLA